MALPNPPTTPDTSKLHYLMYDNATVNTASIWHAVHTETLNSETIGWAAIGTHEDGDADAAGQPLVLIAGSDGSNILPVAIDATGNLQVDIVSGGAAGVQYTEGDVDATITGTAILWEDAADTLVTVNASKPLPVKLAANSGVDVGDVDVLSVVPGTGATNLGKAIDSPSGASDVGIAILAIRDDALSALTPIEDDYVPLRVNSTGALHVTGGGGGTEYTEGDVDATITGTAILWEDAADTLRAVSVAKPLPTQITDGTLIATVRDTGASDSLNVAIVDASGNQITSFGGGVQYTELDVDTTITGTAIMWEDSGNQLKAVSTANALPVLPTHAIIDNQAFTANTSRVTPVGFYVDEVSGTFSTVGENETGAARMSPNRSVYTQIRDGAGNERGLNVDANNNIGVVIRDVAGNSAMDEANDAVRVNIVAGAGSGGTSATDDAAFTAGSGAGTPMMGFATADVVDSGDVGVVAMTLQRALHVTLRDGVGDSVMDDANDAVRVNIVAGAGSGGTAMTDDSAFTAGTTSVTPAAGFYASTRDLVDSGDAGALAMTQRRAIVGADDCFHDTSNSTTTPLGISATFTGSWVSCVEYDTIIVTVDADQDGTIFVDFSTNGGTNTDYTYGFAFSAGVTPQVYHVPRAGTSCRTRYTNGATGQTTFRLQTLQSSGNTGTQVDNFTWTTRLEAIEIATETTATATNSINQNAVWVSGDVWGVGDGGITAMVVRKDTRGNLDAGIVDGDYTSLQVNANGELRVRSDDLQTSLTDRSTFVKITDGTTDATVRNLAANDALNVAIVDASGGHITSFGGGTQYTEDDPAATNPVGTAPILVRADTPATQVSADGDNVAQRGTNYGAAYVQVVTSSGAFVDTFGGSGGTASSYGSAFPATGTAVGFSDGTNMQGARVFDADTGAGFQYVLGTVLRKTASGGSVEAGTATDPLRVDPTGTTTQPVSGTVAATQSGAWNVGLNAGTNNIGDVDVLTVPAPLNVTGTGTEAAALRVTLATDSTGLLSVDDNGSSLTVDAPVGTPVNVQVGDGTNTATIRNLAANDALNVAITDGSGGHITSFGGGTQYTEDDPAATNPVGTAPILVRADTPATQVSLDGDNVAQRGTNYGAAYVQVVTSSGSFVDSFGGSGGTSAVDDSVFTAASGSGTPMMGFATSDAVDAGDVGVVRMSTTRDLYVSIRADNGTTAMSSLAAVKVDQAGWGGATVSPAAVPTDTQGLALSAPVRATLALYNGASTDIARGDVTNGLDVDVTRVSGTVTVDGSAVVQPVSDAAGSLTVDAPVGTPVNVQVGDGANTATIRNLAANDALNVAIVDAAGDQITSFGGGTQYTEGTTQATIVGTAILWEDTSDVVRAVSAAKPLPVSVIGGGGGGTSAVDDSVFTAASGSGTPIMGFATGDQVDFGDVGVVGMTIGRALHTSLQQVAGNNVNALDGAADSSSTALTGLVVGGYLRGFNGTSWDRLRSDITNGLDVDVTRVSGNVTVVNAGTFATQAAQSGTWSVRAQDGAGNALASSTTTPAGTEQALIVRNIPSGTQTVSGTVTANAGTGTHTVAGVVADDGVASGNPVQIGLVARTTGRTAVAAGDVVYAMADTLGKTVTSPYATPDRMTRGTLTKSTTGAADLIAAPGAGLRLYITSISASNTSGTAVRVDFLDNATVVASFFLAASGGGVSHTMPVPIRCAANVAFRVDLGAAVTDVRFSAQGYIAGN